MKDSAVNFILIASPFATLKMTPNVNPAKVIIEKDRIRIMKTLFNLKFQAPDKEVAALLKSFYNILDTAAHNAFFDSS